jgi:hypothetical protein
MSEAKHTPGPWSVVIDDTGGEFTGWPSIVASPEIDCAVIHRAGFKKEFWGDLSQRECIANARLIASAPDLLEALRSLIDMDVAYQRGQRVEAAVDVARAAIAKATGGAAC